MISTSNRKSSKQFSDESEKDLEQGYSLTRLSAFSQLFDINSEDDEDHPIVVRSRESSQRNKTKKKVDEQNTLSIVNEFSSLYGIIAPYTLIEEKFLADDQENIQEETNLLDVNTSRINPMNSKGLSKSVIVECDDEYEIMEVVEGDEGLY